MRRKRNSWARRMSCPARVITSGYLSLLQRRIRNSRFEGLRPLPTRSGVCRKIARHG